MSVLEQRVYVADGYKPFGELTRSDVEARAAELTLATGWGPTARIGAVARAWSDLAQLMAQQGAQTVLDLGVERATELAGPLWVVPPRGSLL
jgi:hypothetical protein